MLANLKVAITEVRSGRRHVLRAHSAILLGTDLAAHFYMVY